MNIQQHNLDKALDEIFTLLEKGDRKQAKYLIKRLAKKYPNHPQCLYVQGLVAAFADNLHTAEKFLLRTIDKQPDHSLAHFNLATCYRKLRRIDKVVLHSYLALQTASDNELKEMQSARELIDSIRADLPDGFTMEDFLKDAASYREACDLMAQGDYVSAAGLFCQIAEHQPKHVAARSNLGACRMKLGDYQGAREAFEQALTLNPDYPAARSNMQILDDLESGKIKSTAGMKVINRGL